MNIEKFCLKDCFWTLTIQATASNLPRPKLDFYFNGFRAFCLQAEGDEFLLLDYEDVIGGEKKAATNKKEEEEAETESKRGFEFMIEDEESHSASQKVFMRAFPGKPETIDEAIDLVAAFFNKIEEWHQTVHSIPFPGPEKLDRVPRLDATISIPVVHFDCEEFQIKRRYKDVQITKGASMHCLSRQSEKCAQLEKLGGHVVNWLRAVTFFFGSATSFVSDSASYSASGSASPPYSLSSSPEGSGKE